MKKQKNGDNKRKLQAATIILFALVLLLVSLMANKTPSKTSDDPRSFGQTKYENLIKSLSPTNVCPDIKPVHIFREVNGKKYLHATGGQIVRDGSILTCGHAFWNTPNEPKAPWKYYYQNLQPYEERFHPITDLQKIDVMETNTVSASRDVMICRPGEAHLINPIQAPGEVISEKTTTFDFYKKYNRKLNVRSTVTGASFNLIGEAKVAGGPLFYVIDYASFRGESGTIFVADNNKTLYILSQSTLLNQELRETYGLDEKQSGITLCSSVTIN